MYKISKLIEASNVIAIAGHVNPDGDCIGSCLGLYKYLIQNFPDKDIHVYLEKVPETYSYISGSECVEDSDIIKKFDLIFALDCGDLNRIGVLDRTTLEQTYLVNIDHHISNTEFGKINMVFPDASSASEIIYELIVEDNGPVTPEIAAALYSGIIQDTGVFKFSCTGQRTMEIAGELMGKGIDHTGILDRIFYEKTYEHQLLMAQALKRSEFYDSVISSYITSEEKLEINADFTDFEGIVNVMLNTRGAMASIFVHPGRNGRNKVSLRSEKSVNVSSIAVNFGGGGHVQASGFDTDLDPETIIKLVREKIVF